MLHMPGILKQTMAGLAAFPEDTNYLEAFINLNCLVYWLLNSAHSKTSTRPHLRPKAKDCL